MTLSEVLLLLTLLCSIAYGVLTSHGKSAMMTRIRKTKRLTAIYFPKYIGQSFFVHVR